MRDLRFALRVLAKSPGFTLAAVLCLALGIGATSAIFSVVNAVVLRPLPYRDAAGLVRVFTEFPTFPNGGLRRFWVSGPEFLELRRDLRTFSAIEAWVTSGVNLAADNEPVRTTAAYVSGGMLEMLGVQPKFGRVLHNSDDAPGVPLNAVLSWGLWQRAYGGDTKVLGRDIRLNGRACTVVGVMPDGFIFPQGDAEPSELWVPLQLDPAHPGGRAGHNYSILARLQPGVTMVHANAEISRYVAQHRSTFTGKVHALDPQFHPILLSGFQDDVIRKVRPAMLVLLGAVGFVLLIACVNVANLLLARAEVRRREIAIRTAVGAGTGRLLRQFIAEGVMLSLAGAAFGLLIAFGGLRVLVAANAGSIPRITEVGIDWQVLLFSLAVSVATGVVFGLAPVFHIRRDLYETLKSASGRTTSAVSTNRFRTVLVAGELAMTLVLLIGSGLMIRAFWKLQQVNAGLEPSHVLTAKVALPPATNQTVGYAPSWARLLERLNALPGVVSAATATGLPPERPINANDTDIEGLVLREGGPRNSVDYYNIVSPRYFETIGARLLEGRYLEDRDAATAPPVVVINQTMARTFWGNESAIGRRVRPNGQTAWATVVGVVADMKNAGLDRPAGTEMFISHAQAAEAGRSLTVLLKTAGVPGRMGRSLREAVSAFDRTIPVASVQEMEDVLTAARARPRFLMLLLGMFSALSLLLAALGLYGVISYSVAQRTNEIGVRMAMGAQKADVLRLILKYGGKLGIAGTLAGGVAAVALVRFLRGLLFGISEFDPATFAAMAALLCAVALLACWIPARRAAKVDPLVALRYE